MNPMDRPIPGAAIKLLLVAALYFPVSSAQTTAFASFTPGGSWLADDGKHIDCHGGSILYRHSLNKYYWYGERRGTPAGVACYSSVDLYNWKNEGVAMQKGTIAVLERPKVVFNATTKKYVMWFHYDNSGYSLAHMGVAMSDSAKGPFTLIDHFLPNGHQSRDLGMYCDDDGKVYLLYAADQTNVTIRMVALSADYLNVTASDFDIKAHCEGPGMFKLNGTYYLLTSKCTGWSPNQATYYTATSAMGPYTGKGDPCIGDTNHTTFNSQPCFIVTIPGYANGFMYMGDRWNGSGTQNSQYVFLPITITSLGAMQLQWRASWTLSVFTPALIKGGGAITMKKSIGFYATNPAGGSALDLLGRLAPAILSRRAPGALGPILLSKRPRP